MAEPQIARHCHYAGQVTGTAGVLRCPACGDVVADNGVRIWMRVETKP